jgi:hypothetical protein
MKYPGRVVFTNLLHYTFGVGIILLLLFIPTPSRLGGTFRSDFTSVALAIFLSYLIISLFSGTLRNTLLFGLAAFLFAVPVAGLRSSGQSEQYIIGGIIPFSDARFYYMDARRLLEGSQFMTGAGRRPIFAAMLSTFQWLTTQNLYLTIGLLILVITLTVYFAVREVHSAENAVGAGFFLILIFFYIRFLLGKTMSEMAGLPLGLLAFFFLCRSSREKKELYYLIGLFFLTLALNARAGAFFILPMLIIWSLLTFRTSTSNQLNWRMFGLGILVVAAGFALNLLMFNILSNPDNTPFGNFSYTLYGLARGGQSWTLIYEEHPEISAMPSGQTFAYVYDLAFQSIRSNPADLFKGMLNSYATFFSLDDYYGSLCWFGGSNTVGAAARLGLYGLMAAGLIVTLVKIKDATRSLMAFAFAGIILSVVFLPPRDSNHMRVFAATFPFFAMIPALGLSYIYSLIPLKKPLFPDNLPISPVFPGIMAVLILVSIVIVPLVLRYSAQPPQLTQGTCPEGSSSLSFRVLPGNHFNIHEQGSINQDWAPDLQKKNFVKLAHDLPNWELFPVLTDIDQGQMLISDLNLNTMKEMILIADRDKIKAGSAVQSVCAVHQDDLDLKLYNVYIMD